MSNWQDSTRELEGLLRLRTFPLAVKFMKKREDVDKIPRVRKLDHHYNFCQLVGLSRTVGWTLVALPEYLGLGCQELLGFVETLSKERKRNLAGVWFENVGSAEKQRDSRRTIPFDGHQAVVVGPLASEKFEPDIILIHGTPAQMHLLMCAFIYKDYQRLQFFFVGEGSCNDTLGECYFSGKPALSIPCYGQRRYGHVRDDELEMAIPPNWLAKGLDGLRWLSSKGLRYPIPYWGVETDPTPGEAVNFPRSKAT